MTLRVTWVPGLTGARGPLTPEDPPVLSRPMEPTTQLEAAAARRHGVITRAQARAGGLSDRQIRLRVSSGRWRRHSKDVFSVSAAPRTQRQALLAATLRHGAVACNWSAAWLLQLRDTAPGRPDVARSSARGSKDPGTVVHRTADLEPRDIITVDSISTTNATRTLLDLASVTTDAELRRLIDRACREGLTHRDALGTRFATFRASGRPGCARVHRVLAGMDHDSSLVESDLESLLLTLIVAAGLPAPVAQYPVTVDSAHYRLDFAYPARRIAIEGDGFAFHSDRQRFESDRQRQNDLVLDGWLVLRFTWRQIVHQPDQVAARIAAALDLRASGSAPG
jgi:hypothetical protein